MCILIITDISVRAFTASTTVNKSYDDEMLENMRAYQLDFLDNGDAVIYSGKRLVGIHKYNTTCGFHKIIDRDND
jgi:hypothetical protein